MKLLEIDLGSPLPAIPRAHRGQQWVVVRLHGESVGVLRLGDRPYEPAELAESIVRELGARILIHLVADGLRSRRSPDSTLDLSEIPAGCPRAAATPSQPVTVAVCTRGRPEQLSTCLESLLAIEYPEDRLQLLVVDNAPASDATERLVRRRSPRFSYVEEPRPGLNWARNRAVLESEGAVVAFTDDDASVDPGWVRAIVATFEREPDAMAVTGLVLPDELDEPTQLLFEEYGGFSRGFSRRHFQIDPRTASSVAEVHGGSGKFGTGANMAFRRSLFDLVGLFDPALDVGTVTNGGGDLEMFFRVLKAGHMLVYEPAALVRHRHRREYSALRAQLANNGIGFYSYLVRSAGAYPEERRAFARLGAWWFLHWNVRRLARSIVQPGTFPRDLVVAELRGSIAGLTRYHRASGRAAEILREHGLQRPTGKVNSRSPNERGAGGSDARTTERPDDRTTEPSHDRTTERPHDPPARGVDRSRATAGEPNDRVTEPRP